MSKSIDAASVLPDVIAERFPFSNQLTANFERRFKRPTFAAQFWKAERKGTSREFCAMFFNHWTEAIAAYKAGHGRKPVWFND